MGSPRRNLTLARERFDKGLTVEQVAAEADVHPDTYRRAEMGIHVPRPGAAKRIADFFDLKPTEIWPIEDSETTR